MGEHDAEVRHRRRSLRCPTEEGCAEQSDRRHGAADRHRRGLPAAAARAGRSKTLLWFEASRSVRRSTGGPGRVRLVRQVRSARRWCRDRLQYRGAGGGHAHAMGGRERADHRGIHAAGHGAARPVHLRRRPARAMAPASEVRRLGHRRLSGHLSCRPRPARGAAVRRHPLGTGGLPQRLRTRRNRAVSGAAPARLRPRPHPRRRPRRGAADACRRRTGRLSIRSAATRPWPAAGGEPNDYGRRK
jgi:hypothetical protein